MGRYLNTGKQEMDVEEEEEHTRKKPTYGVAGSASWILRSEFCGKGGIQVMKSEALRRRLEIG